MHCREYVSCVICARYLSVRMRAVLLGSHNAQCIDVAGTATRRSNGAFCILWRGSARCATTLSVREKMVHTSKGALLGSDIQSHAAPRDIIGRPRSLRSRASGAVRGRPRPLYYTAHHAILGGLLTSPHWLTKVCPETLLLLHASRVPFTCFAPAVAVTFVTAKTAPVGGRVGTRVITNQLVGMRVPA